MAKKEKKEKKLHKIFGHKLVIKDVKENKWEPANPILTATCIPHCCTTPYGIRLTCPKDDFEKIIKEDKS